MLFAAAADMVPAASADRENATHEFDPFGVSDPDGADAAAFAPPPDAPPASVAPVSTFTSRYTPRWELDPDWVAVTVIATRTASRRGSGQFRASMNHWVS